MEKSNFIRESEITLKVLILTFEQEREILDSQKMEYAGKFYRIEGRRFIRKFRNDFGTLRFSEL